MAKIIRGEKSGVVVTMGRKDTAAWEDSGDAGDRFRRDLRTRARAFAAKHETGGSIEIYAASSAGGWTADVERVEVAS